MIGGLIGNQVCGPLAPPDWAAPGSLVAVLHPLLGQAHGVVGGMVAGALAASVAGRLARPRGVSAAHEPLIALPFVVLIYLVLRDALVAASVATGLACAIYLGAILFRLLALLLSAGCRGERRDDPAEPPGGWPVYTVLVPLYRETQVAQKILRSLEHLDYPRDRLDVKLLLEADDPATLAAVQAAGVPAWIEVVVVPQEELQAMQHRRNWVSLQKTRGESDVYVQTNVWQPGGSTGWHSHPGHSLILVTAGTVTVYEGSDPQCKPNVYTAGMGFVDPGGDHVHNIRNETTSEAKTIAVQLIPADADRRLGVDAPKSCPF